MKKRIIFIGVLSALVANVSLAGNNPPTTVVKNQNSVENYYTNQSKKTGSNARANAHLNHIRDTIKKLQLAENRFENQTSSGGSSNPFAKYNGVWELTTGSTNLTCNDYNRTRLPVDTVVSRARIKVANNGVVTVTPLEVNQTPGDRIVSGSERFQVFQDGRIRVEGGARRYSQTDGYYDQEYIYNGRFSSKIHFSGTQKLAFYYHDYDVTCSGSYKMTGNKVGN